MRFPTKPKTEICLNEAEESSAECSQHVSSISTRHSLISILIVNLESTGLVAWNLYRGMTLTRMHYSTFVERPFSPSRPTCNLNTFWIAASERFFGGQLAEFFNIVDLRSWLEFSFFLPSLPQSFLFSSLSFFFFLLFLRSFERRLI